MDARPTPPAAEAAGGGLSVGPFTVPRRTVRNDTVRRSYHVQRSARKYVRARLRTHGIAEVETTRMLVARELGAEATPPQSDVPCGACGAAQACHVWVQSQLLDPCVPLCETCWNCTSECASTEPLFSALGE